MVSLLTDLGEPILSTTLIAPGEGHPLNDPDSIADQMSRSLALILSAGQTPGAPTTVVDLPGNSTEVMRLGNGSRLGLSAV